METRKCALPNCDNIVKNWRWVCCCPLHNRQYAGLRRHSLVEKIVAPKLPNLKKGFGKSKPTPYKNRSPEEKAKWCAYVVNRRKKRDKSMPLWANKDLIEQMYQHARQLTEITGIMHEVDHIIPTSNKLVCGLHVENNLQIITKEDNRIKSNKFSIM